MYVDIVAKTRHKWTNWMVCGCMYEHMQESHEKEMREGGRERGREEKERGREGKEREREREREREHKYGSLRLHFTNQEWLCYTVQ